MVEKYIVKWEEGIDTLQHCRYPYTLTDAAIQFVMNGPYSVATIANLSTQGH